MLCMVQVMICLPIPSSVGGCDVIWHVQTAQMNPCHMAYDRPSNKLLSFLR